MPDVQRTIEILFVGTDAVSDVIGSITSDLGNLNSAVADVTAPFATIAESALKAELAVVSLGAAFGEGRYGLAGLRICLGRSGVCRRVL